MRKSNVMGKSMRSSLILILAVVAISVVATPLFAADMIGRDACLTCHTPMEHRAILSHDMQDENSCETCHGPGSVHMNTESSKDIRTFREKSLDALDEANGVCLNCHGGAVERHWTASNHQSAGVGCADCHTIQHPGQPRPGKMEMSQSCMACHTDVRAKVLRQHGHPLRHGQMNCSDCHQPHEPAGDKELRQFTVNENCYTCHAEKRGPFLWEHEPVFEECTVCHDPHGSIQPGALVRRAPQLCQQCHHQPHSRDTHSDALYDFSRDPRIARSVLGQSCMNCHSQVHGSNHPSGLYLMR